MSRSAKVSWQKLLCENAEKQITEARRSGTSPSHRASKHATFHFFKEMSTQRLPELSGLGGGGVTAWDQLISSLGQGEGSRLGGRK